MNSVKVSDRIYYLDIAKVFVAFLVVLGHFYSPDSDASILRRYIYTFHMPFFFLISGMFHHYGKNSLINNFIKYFKTLIIPTCFFVILYIVIVPPIVGMIENGNGYFPLLVQAFKMQYNELISTTHLYYNSVCWFLLSLFGCKLLADVFYWNKYVGFIVIVGLLIAIWSFHSSLFYILQAIIALPFYFVGGFLKNKLSYIYSFKYKPFIAIFLGLICYVLMLLNGRVSLLAHMFGNLPIPINLLCFYVNAIIGSLAVLTLAMCINIRYNLFARLAQSLITILGFQAFLLKPFLQWYDGYNYCLITKVSISIIIVFLCYIFHLIIMRYLPSLLGK